MAGIKHRDRGVESIVTCKSRCGLWKLYDRVNVKEYGQSQALQSDASRYQAEPATSNHVAYTHATARLCTHTAR